MLIKPNDHYDLVETTLKTSSELQRYFEEIEAKADEAGCDVYWRGQANSAWAVTSSLVRLMANDELTDADLQKVENRILAESKDWLVAERPKLRSNLEWLAYLQHNWVPTRLLDFSPDPYIATFFAVEAMDEVDGRLFAVLLPRDDEVLDGSVDVNIGDIKSGSIKIFKPRAEVSPRLAAQSGVFLLGKLPSTQVHRWVWDEYVEENRQMLKDEVSAIMSLPFYFTNPESARRAESKSVTAYTARIHVNKASIRRQLRKAGGGRSHLTPTTPVTHQTCYPDVDGMRRFSNLDLSSGW
ncbi:FRG domain-containing protein [Brachybacterium sp. Marseille-Q2903]|uniref:FRG domain-containing protein n=2 Tax=Brachybacterium TaxID=43668 RepID=A0ABR9VYD8_9MICO|nr:FRG domain-containing protein [Brachybacterium epidermidis]